MKCSVLLGRPLEIKKISGIVIDKERWNESHVSGSGGGSIGADGQTTSININTRIVNKEKIWLKDSDGKEFSWNLTNVDISEREGHTLSAVYSSKSSETIALYNHNMDKIQWLSGNYKKHLFPSKIGFWIVAFIFSIIGLYKDTNTDNLIYNPNLENFLVFIVYMIIVAIPLRLLLELFIYIRKIHFTRKCKTKIEKYLRNITDF